MEEEEKEICREKRKEKVATVVTERRCLGGGYGGNDGFHTADGGGGGQRPRWREKEERGLCREKNWGEGWFFQFLDSIFSSIRSSIEPLFIDSRRG